MAKSGNGGKVKAGVHAHERNMHPGKPLTPMPSSVSKASRRKPNKKASK